MGYNIDKIRQMLTEYHEEIPDRIIHSDEPDNKYKVRISWFSGLFADIANAVDEGELTTREQRGAAKAYLKRFKRERVSAQQVVGTSRRDIEVANRLAKVVVGDIPRKRHGRRGNDV